VDGVGHLRILRSVIGPMVRAGIAAAAIFIVITSWNELLFAVMLTTTNRTAPAGIVAP
jgi:ABC-type glycerol-3-phosphate transport system permease component